MYRVLEFASSKEFRSSHGTLATKDHPQIIWSEVVVQCFPHPFLILGKDRIWGAERIRVEPLAHSLPNLHPANKLSTVNYRSKFLLYLLVPLVHIQRHFLECPSNAIYPPRRLLGDPPTPLPSVASPQWVKD